MVGRGDTPRASATTGESDDAFKTPFVSRSILSANSGGNSVECRNCDNRPLDMPTAVLNSVSDNAPGLRR